MRRLPPTSFRSAYATSELMDAVAEVATAAGADGRAVTRARFDAARRRGGHPNLPRADRIARRLGVPFSELLARSLSGQDSSRWVARRNPPSPRAPDPAEGAHALRVVAAAARARSLTPGEYRRHRRELLADDHAHHRHGRRLILPDEHQVAAAFDGDWQPALSAAGLTGDRSQRPAGSRAPRQRGAPVEQVLEWCLEYYGALASKQEMQQFARAHNITTAHYTPPWEGCVDRMREARTARGLWTPRRPPAIKDRPDFAQIIPESEALAAWKTGAVARKRRVRAWTAEQCVAALMRFLQENPGVALTQRNYVDWLGEQADRLPQVSTFQRVGRFSELAAQAQKQAARS